MIFEYIITPLFGPQLGRLGNQPTNLRNFDRDTEPRGDRLENSVENAFAVSESTSMERTGSFNRPDLIRLTRTLGIFLKRKRHASSERSKTKKHRSVSRKRRVYPYESPILILLATNRRPTLSFSLSLFLSFSLSLSSFHSLSLSLVLCISRHTSCSTTNAACIRAFFEGKKRETKRRRSQEIPRDTRRRSMKVRPSRTELPMFPASFYQLSFHLLLRCTRRKRMPRLFPDLQL